MTTTAHEDQFTAECITIWNAMAANTLPISKDAKAIAVWLDRHGYCEIAARIRAGEHLA